MNLTSRTVECGQMPLKVMITGGSGFLGRSLVGHLSNASRYSLVVPLRRHITLHQDNVTTPLFASLASTTDWRDILQGIDAVVHCAAHVHVVGQGGNDLQAFREINVAATLNLARQAIHAGVTRFIFISSIKVNGERTIPGQSFSADDQAAPCDAYGISKLEAEQALRLLLQDTSMDLVIIRPVLIYGPGVKANFRKIMDLCYSRLPLPFLRICNKRSLVSVTNVADLIEVCLHHPAAASEIFLVSDGEDLSTPEIIMLMGAALGRSNVMWGVPGTWLSAAAELFGFKPQADRLLESLQVSIEKNRVLLNWAPVQRASAGFKLTADQYLAERSK